MAGKRTGSIRADAVKKFFPQASTKDIVKYLENLRWIEETLFQWASIVESTDDAIYTKDFNGIITSWNPAAERIYGYSASEIVGQSILKIFPDDRKGEFKKIISKIRKGIKIDHYRTLRKTKSGDLIDVSVTISPTRDITGKIVGASVIARNITEEKKVADLKQRFSSIVESSSDAIIGKNLSGIITSWNNGAEAMYGYTSEEAIGKSIKIIFPEGKDKELDTILNKIKRGIKIDHFETVRRRKDGELIKISLTASPIKDSEGKISGVSVIAHEITKELELERERNLNRLKNDFISMASHELKTPITVLKTYAQLIFKENESIKNGNIENAITKSLAQIERLTNLVNQLLVLSKIQENRYKFSNQKFNLNELVEDIAEDLSESTDGFDIKIEGKVDKEVTGDKEKISQVLINLITNAMKYSDKISKIDIGLKSNSREAVVSVRDYGIGIPQEFHSKIFERFYQVGGGSKNTYPGMGIGLFISSEIIKAHGGQIWLDSRVGKGTKFYFSLPYH